MDNPKYVEILKIAPLPDDIDPEEYRRKIEAECERHKREAYAFRAKMEQPFWRNNLRWNVMVCEDASLSDVPSWFAAGCHKGDGPIDPKAILQEWDSYMEWLRYEMECLGWDVQIDGVPTWFLAHYLMRGLPEDKSTILADWHSSQEEHAAIEEEYLNIIRNSGTS